MYGGFGSCLQLSLSVPAVCKAAWDCGFFAVAGSMCMLGWVAVVLLIVTDVYS